MAKFDIELEVINSTIDDPRTNVEFIFNFAADTVVMKIKRSPVSVVSLLFDSPSHSQTLKPVENSGLAGAAVLAYTLDRCGVADAFWEQVDFRVYWELNDLPILRGHCALLHRRYLSAIEEYRFYQTSYDIIGFDDDIYPVEIPWSYVQLGEVDRALKLADELVKIRTKSPTKETPIAYASRAQLYTLANRYDDAIEDYNTAIALSPTNPTLYIMRAQTYLLLYEWDKVLADCNSAIEIDPTYAEAYYQRGLLYYSILQTGSSLYEQALDDFNHYLDLAPNGVHAEDATRYADEIKTLLEALGVE
ncbi:MAG: tetratricopeptide repeat protein [Anaerolineae bacterium]